MRVSPEGPFARGENSRRANPRRAPGPVAGKNRAGMTELHGGSKALKPHQGAMSQEAGTEVNGKRATAWRQVRLPWREKLWRVNPKSAPVREDRKVS